ncbi:MAG TPA: preprotein translocase subunit SecG [Firmicutes bacterium]|nr:preprotein translocase subunit SecG [Bacillota bacterium]
MINSLLEVTIFWNQSIEGVYYAINYTLVVLMAISALAAIILVMLQPGNSQGIDALGGTSETFYGKNKGRSIESKLKMWTIICLAVLAVLAIVFFILQIPAIWGPVD